MSRKDCKILTCDICGAANWIPLYSKRIVHPNIWKGEDNPDLHLNYEGCVECGYITLNPRLSDKQYEEYYRECEPPSREAFVRRYEIYKDRADFLYTNLPRRINTIIEIGAGYGDFLLMAQGCERRIGIEPSRECCEFTKSNHPELEYYNCSLEEAFDLVKGIEGVGDLVVAANVLEHVSKPRLFMRKLVQLTRNDGYVYIEVPSVEEMGRCKAPLYQTVHIGHISQFSVPVLNKLAMSEGLEPMVVKTSRERNYPVLRAVYSRRPDPTAIAGMFIQHCASIDSETIQAGDKVKAELQDSEEGSIVLWGCGQDLIDALDTLNTNVIAILQKKGVLIDINPNKRGKVIKQMVVNLPEQVDFSAVKTVMIASRSDIIQDDIKKYARNMVPKAEIRFLYPRQ